MSRKILAFPQLTVKELKCLLETYAVTYNQAETNRSALQQLALEKLPQFTAETVFEVRYDPITKDPTHISVDTTGATPTTQRLPSTSTSEQPPDLQTVLQTLTTQMASMQNTLQQHTAMFREAKTESEQTEIEPHAVPSTLYDASTSSRPVRPDMPQVMSYEGIKGISLSTIAQKVENYDHTTPQTLNRWFRQLEMLTCGITCNDKDLFTIICMGFKGKAAEMLFDLKKSKKISEIHTYQANKSAIISHFIPKGTFQKAAGEFFTRIQRPHETMDQYRDALQDLAAYGFHDQAPELVEFLLVSKLKTNSLPKIQEYLSIMRPSTVDECMSYAREKESMPDQAQTKVKTPAFATASDNNPVPQQATWKNRRFPDQPGSYPYRPNQGQRYCQNCNMNNHRTEDCRRGRFQNQNSRRDVRQRQQSRSNESRRPNQYFRSRDDQKSHDNRKSAYSVRFRQCEDDDLAQRRCVAQEDDESSGDDHHGNESLGYANAATHGKPITTKSRRTRRRIEIQGKLEDGPATFFVDTGSSLTLCDRQFLNSLNANVEIYEPTRTVYSLSNAKLKIKGRVVLRVHIGSMDILHMFHIVEGCPVKLLLGSDFLDKSRAVIDYPAEEIRFGKTKVPMQDSKTPREVFTAFVCQSKIPARSSKLIKALVRNVPDGQTLVISKQCFTCNSATCLHHVDSDKSESAYAETMAHAHNEDSVVNVKRGEIAFEIFNLDDTEVEIKADTEIDVQPIGADVVHDFKSMLTSLTPPQPTEVETSYSTSHPHRPPQVDKPTAAEIIKNLRIEETTKSFTIEQRNKLIHSIVKYIDIFVYDDTNLGRTNVVTHKIELTDPKPIALPPRRLPHSQREFVQRYLKELIEKGFIVASKSPYASPIVLVPKSDGTIRLCIDYRLLNQKTKPDQYPLPHTDDLFDILGKAVVFTKLDACSGFWQIAMEFMDQEKTAFRTLAGYYEFTVMPFGLRNAPATFQRMMEQVLRPYLFKTSVALIDDILIFSESIDAHVSEDVPNVLQSLQEHNLKLKIKKCEFGAETLEFLGHTIGNGEIRPIQKKVEAISKMKVPANVHELRRFLGMVNYYRKFIPNMATIAESLNELKRLDVKYEMTSKRLNAVQQLKDALTSEPVMTSPDFSKPFILTTDASLAGLGAILSQQHGKHEKVIAYASRSIRDTEKSYAITELEALAVVWGIKHFKVYLYNTRFKVITDHHALIWLMSTKHTNQRLARWALELQGYDYEIVYRKGALNENADCLSRSPVDTAFAATSQQSEMPTLAVLKREQRNDPRIMPVIRFLETGELPLEKKDLAHVKAEGDNYMMEKGLLRHLFHQMNIHRRNTVFSQAVIPQAYKKLVLTAYHDDSLSGHLGFHKTYNKVRAKYYWRNLYSEVRDHVLACRICQQKKSPSRSARETLVPLPPTSYPFQRVACDFCTFTRTTGGNKYIVVFTDYTTRYVEAFATSDQTAEATAALLIDKIICRHSAPAEFLSDRGPNFCSDLLKQLCKQLKIRKTFTSSYHPATDGLTERFNRTLQNMLATYTSNHQKDWDVYLPMVVMAYNTAIQDSTQQTPFYLLYGRDPVLPFDATLGFQQTDDVVSQSELLTNLREAWNLAHENTKAAQAVQKRNYDKRAKQQEFRLGDLVFIQDPTQPIGKSKKLLNPWKGPFRIIEKTSEVTYRLENTNGSPVSFHNNVNSNRLKPCFNPTRGKM